MVSSQNPNLEILTLAVNQLGELADDMVFFGGYATGLLISDPAAPPIRAPGHHRVHDRILRIPLHSGLQHHW